MNKLLKLIHFFLVFVLAAGLLAPATVPVAQAKQDEPRAHPALLQLAAEHPDDTFMVIIQREVKNKDLKDDDPEIAVNKAGGKVGKQLTLIESFSAELTGKEIGKLAKNPKVRWITFDAPLVSTAAGDPTARDEFGSVSYSNNNGPQAWGSNWVEGGDDNSPSGGYVKISSGSLQLRYINRTLSRQINLTGSAVATLSFQYKRSSFDNSSDYVAIEISANGGSTWTELARYAGAGTDSAWQTASFYIQSYAASNTQIRFATSPSLGSSDILYLDNIQIEYASASKYTAAVRADQLWSALQGQGVTVAVVDSGIASHNDLSHIVASTNQTTSTSASDGYGHGTHVAGIIGGNGSLSGGVYTGVAPAVNLINVKVSNDLGLATTSDLIDGLQWILDNKAAYNIRVVNISLNSTVAESYHTSPLDAAVEILWFNGIVVVAAAGNNGTGSGPVTLYPPANDPFVITVGAAEDKGTASLADDVVASFSAYGGASESGSLDIRISSSSDDAEEEGAGGAHLGPGGMYLASSDLELMQDYEAPSSGTQAIGLRFNGISLPQGAIITNAYLRFRAIAPDSGNSNSGAANFTIQGQAADSVTTFLTTAYDISNRPRTTASVQWAPAAWTAGALYDSPNLTGIVQEIVNRPGWASGNSIAFVIRCTDGAPTANCGSRSADSWDGSPTTAPLLHIEWNSGNSAKPDLVAPGRHVVSTLAGTSAYAFLNHLAHRVDSNYFRMSGTSMAAPVVSGAVALLLQDEPNLTPDQVKYRLKATANTAWPGYDAVKAGAGYLDAYAAVNGATTQSANTGLAVSQMLFSGSDPAAWGSVNWNSVNWNSVNWNSVNWNSVNWNSVNWNSAVWDD